MRIMIIEDDESTAYLIESALKQFGHNADAYGHGGLAIGAIVRGNYELLICDLMLPDLHGVDAIGMVRSQFPYLPIIAISAMDPDEWRPKSLNAGANCFIGKPLHLADLYEEVRIVEQSQVHLKVGVIDGDSDHRHRVGSELESMGCTVSRLDDDSGAIEAWDTDELTIVLVDATVLGAHDVIMWAKAQGTPAVAFNVEKSIYSDSDLMRVGAAFCMSKPVDIESFITQARFFVSPEDLD